MRPTFTTLPLLSLLLPTLHALTITTPATGSTLDPSQPITIKWTHTSTDPATFNLIVSSDQSSVFTFDNGGKTQIGSNIRTSSGSYTIPPNTINAFGSGFSVSAQSASGGELARSGSFLLGYGAGSVVQGANGQYSLVPAGAQTTLSSISFDTSGLEGQSVTATYFPGTVGSGTVVVPTTLSSLVFSTGGVTGSMTVMSTRTGSSSGSSVTGSRSSSSSSSLSSSHSASASSSSAAAAATANAQGKVGAGREVVGFVGLVAGMVALVA